MHLLTKTALITALLTTTAFAQTNQQSSQQRASGQQTNVQFVSQQKPNEWSAEALIGRDVYNMQNESLGEINNVILSQDGRVSAVTIGIGGLLGLGEKNVGVPFNALQFRADGQGARAQATANRQQQQQSGQQGRTGPQGQTGQQAGKQQTGQMPQGQTGQQPQQQTAQDGDQGDLRWKTEHSNVRIYLDATKQQLENAPDFVWLSEQEGQAQQGGRTQ